VYLDTVRGYSREQLESELFGADDVSLALFYGDGGVLAGFSYASIDRVAHDGRDHAVFCAAVFFRLEDPARLRALAKDPDAQFYVGLDPRFAEGDALLVWMPLDAANIVGGLLQLALARLWQ
jgi:hypothetical protein